MFPRLMVKIICGCKLGNGNREEGKGQLALKSALYRRIVLSEEVSATGKMASNPNSRGGFADWARGKNFQVNQS
jgi:hypothetical protein